MYPDGTSPVANLPIAALSEAPRYRLEGKPSWNSRNVNG